MTSAQTQGRRLRLLALGKHGARALLHSVAFVLLEIASRKVFFCWLERGLRPPIVIMYIFVGVSARAEINVELVCNVISEMLATCSQFKLRAQKLIFGHSAIYTVVC